MQIPESALENMPRLLTRESRLKLFENLCKILDEPIPERVWLKTGIRKTNVYRYLPKSKSRRGGFVPSSETTVRIIRALIHIGAIQVVLEALDPIEQEMRRTARDYFDWKKALRKENIIFDPLSRKEIDRIEKSQY